MAFISEWTLHENQSVLKHYIFLSVRCKIAHGLSGQLISFVIAIAGSYNIFTCFDKSKEQTLCHTP